MQQWRNLMNSKTLGEFSQGERNIRVLRSFFRVLLFVSSGPESQLLTKWVFKQSFPASQEGVGGAGGAAGGVPELAGDPASSSARHP